ncbi:src-like-adapter isoform X2 [Oncorhynchus masou masou]|uniref:src-like-adapter isoform X2 n=1 Tax=Oncorhynchus masou masou TaxID=90313 RepID=UPI0031844C71
MGNVMRGGENSNETNTNCHDSVLKGEDDTLVVLHDYPFPDISEPIFRMGEKLRVLSQEGNWWRVRSGQSGREHYIPNNYVAKVYHGWLFEGVARQKAEELLRLPVNRVGSFMIRESTQQRDSADGLCCVLTGPCLCGTANLLDTTTQPPPVVMRRNNFDWKKVDRKDLISAGAPQGQQNRDTMVSYGVRNSIASYLSLAGAQGPRQQPKNHKKNKSVYVTSHSLSHMDLEEDYDT